MPSIESVHRGYFNSYNQLVSDKSGKLERVIALVKLISFATIVIPLALSLAYNISKVVKRVQNPDYSLLFERGINGSLGESFASIPSPFPDLEDYIGKMQARGDADRKKKAILFSRALRLFQEKRGRRSLETACFSSSEAKNYRLDASHSPEYFKRGFTSRNLKVETKSSFYDYDSRRQPFEHYWVDFANTSLGGGALSHGFVQEEIMAAEMPEFADHLASNLDRNGKSKIHTRRSFSSAWLLSSPNVERVMEGSPTPYLMKGLLRVQAIDTSRTYGDKFRNISERDLEAAISPLPQPQEVNVLAIAAPRLFTRNLNEQADLRTIKDLFNTAVAGFSLAKKNTVPEKSCLIHTGPIGCGVFNHCPVIAFLVQYLAAQHVNVEVDFYGCNKNTASKALKIWNKMRPQIEGKSIEFCLEVLKKEARLELF